MRVVIATHAASYPDPLAVRAGESVVPGERDPEAPGWIWCVDLRGKGGWTPEGWLEEREGRWVATRDYDSRELSVAAGEALEVLEEVAGWAWCRRAGGERGWVPVVKLGSGL